MHIYIFIYSTNVYYIHKDITHTDNIYIYLLHTRAYISIAWTYIDLIHIHTCLDYIYMFTYIFVTCIHNVYNIQEYIYCIYTYIYIFFQPCILILHINIYIPVAYMYPIIIYISICYLSK